MDLSKLPKLSDTQSAQGPPDAPPPMPAAAPAVPVRSARPLSPAGLAETWLSIGVGTFILLFWPRFLQWASSRLFHTHFDEFQDPTTAAVVPYPSVPEFWSDLGPTLFGVTLVVDGLLLFTRRPLPILIALGLTTVTTLFNLGWVIYSFGKYGLAPVSLLAVVFGGFILATQWASFQATRAAGRGA